ncbi:chorismate mutase [Terrihabitans sp. B22-R8]|uniref:chorismate mutase n=1 Tax=Terrihabitans sp. B22-R8 TaxID=3425128 RepID=UPI00403D5258
MSADREVLASIRTEIDALDEELVGLLARRLKIVERVVVLKKEHGIPALLPERVDDVIGHVRGHAQTIGAPDDLVEQLYREIIAWTVRYEEGHLGT